MSLSQVIETFAFGGPVSETNQEEFWFSRAYDHVTIRRVTVGHPLRPYRVFYKQARVHDAQGDELCFSTFDAAQAFADFEIVRVLDRGERPSWLDHPIQIAGFITRDGVQTRHEYLWRDHDSGRAASRRPKAGNDCTVRAVVLATGLPYDEVYDHLALEGRKSHRGMHGFRDFIEGTRIGGKRFVYHAFPAVKGQMRMNPSRFGATHPEGVWIVKTAKHVNAVIDGVWFDTFPSDPFRCIYGAWKAVDA